ncbi:MAG TPA: XrtA/PEP-CTERM system TPR-repeat protein PrsT, partial [Burkholderiaceae bacterium]
MNLRPLVNRSLLLALALAGLAGPACAVDNAKAAKYYEDALTRFEKKDIPGAIIQLKNALQIDKTLLPVQLLLGKALLAESQPAAAEIAFTEALRLGVNRAEVAVPLAQALVGQGKQPQLFTLPALVLAGLPSSTQAELLLIRASAYSDMGDQRAAFQSIEQARALDPSAPESWLAEVPLRIRTRQFSEANVAVNKALALRPNLSQAHYQKGEVAHVQGDIAGALAAYQRALQIDPANTEARIARIGLLIDSGRDADARADVALLAEQAPNEPRGQYLRALLAERAGDPAQMRASLRQVVALLDPVPIAFIHYRPQLLMLNGLAHFGLEEPGKAKPYLELFQKVQGNSPVSKLLAQIYLAESTPDRAADVLDSYLRAQPGDAQALMMLAGILINQGRHARATALLQEGLSRRDRPELRAVLGLSLLRGGQAGDARTQLETAYRRDPALTQAALTLATLYLQAGQTQRALALLTDLLKRQPNNPSYLTLQGAAHLQVGNVAAARADFERALVGAPKLLAAQIGLARIDIAAKKFDAAAQRLDGILKGDARNIDAMLEQATLATRRGQSEQAQRWLSKAVDVSGPRELRPSFALVEHHLREKQALPALEAARQLLSRAPEDAVTLQVYARAQLANGDPGGARLTLTNAVRRANADDANLLGELARLQMTANDLPGAAYSLEKALQGTPGNTALTLLAGRVDLEQGDFSRAEKRAQSLVQSAPRDAGVQVLLGDIASARKQWPQALAAYRRAHDTSPSSATLLKMLPAIAAVDGFKAAQQAAERWLKAHPRDIAVHRAAADAQASTGNWAAARAAYEQL